jgi:hypothetical protein
MTIHRRFALNISIPDWVAQREKVAPWPRDPNEWMHRMNAITKEAVRQQTETFEQLKQQDRQWFALRLTMGYAAIILLLGVFAICAVILFGARVYPEFVIKAASVTLFADVVSLVVAVWKFALASGTQNRLYPITSAPDSHQPASRPIE